MCYPLTVDHVMSTDAPICSNMYAVKPKDHRFVQINEMTQEKKKKKKETKLFIYVIKPAKSL